MPDAGAFILGKWLAGKITKKNETKVNGHPKGYFNSDDFLQKYEMELLGDEYSTYLAFKGLDLSIPEQEQQAIKMINPEDEEDEERVFCWGYCLQLAVSLIHNFALSDEQKALHKKALLCVNTLLRINDQNWIYWYLYAKIDSMKFLETPKMNNIGEFYDFYETNMKMSKGWENAKKLNPRTPTDSRNLYVEKLYEEIRSEKMS